LSESIVGERNDRKNNFAGTSEPRTVTIFDTDFISVNLGDSTGVHVYWQSSIRGGQDPSSVSAKIGKSTTRLKLCGNKGTQNSEQLSRWLVRAASKRSGIDNLNAVSFRVGKKRFISMKNGGKKAARDSKRRQYRILMVEMP